MRSTGFPLKVRVAIIERAQGRCERCGEAKPGMQCHHRRPRGMGSTRRPETNYASNGLYLCGECHAWVESYRTAARDEGLLVHGWQNPVEVGVHLHRGFVLLGDDGSVSEVAA